MPIYEIGVQGGGDLEVGLTDHRHSGFEEPIAQDARRRRFQVQQGNYQGGQLEVFISAVPEGQEGYALVTPPAYVEIDPGQGLFDLAEDLPAGWLIRIRYPYL